MIRTTRLRGRVHPRNVRIALSIAAALAALALAGPSGAGTSRVAVFYYPWYSSAAQDGSWGHWAQAGHLPPTDVASDFLPARGAYSSTDPAILQAQMADIASTGAGIVVSSWWGWGSLEDERLPAVMAAARAQGLRVGVQIEPYGGRSAASVAGDVRHLRELGIADFWVYRAGDTPAGDWAAVLPGLLASLPGVRVVAHTWLAGWAAAAGFSGVYTYDVLLGDGGAFPRLCAQARKLGLLCEPSVGPGFSAVAATGEQRTRARRDGRTYDTMWHNALAAGADVVTVTSYNEWHEGSQIEPAAPAPAGSRYADYDGAWGLHGAQAAGAYLARTALWVQRADVQAAATEPAAVARILAAWPDPQTRPSPAGRRSSRTR